ncbi:MAG: flagellar basal body P-ring formation chaperone FlgA [Geminicoccaceae bacterium]|nr:flagellar basal body P-ring formation chaperone FlgA [Geminicoccaceae bacterium]MCS7268361.1 flagellar basal body P-ring formation chaperone FlgA [Geminicoccaceae bacterium]MDW8124254.1 flagellar basal body P-ring formation chaperone FlgA [Geminicoccaceae bacterium]MDW8341137.1 flagellar basal body P-ring formation chaperone FlgA [Geminicoccaceae bacterium]
MRPRPLAFLAVVLSALGAAASSAAELVLAAREPLARGALVALLEGALPPAGEGRRLVPVVTSPALPLANPADRPVTVALDGLIVDEARRRFRGELVVRIEGRVTGAVPIEGRLQALVAVPVPSRPVREGELLEPAALATAWVAEDAVRPEVLLDPASAIGREAARPLPAGRPIRESDLRAPRAVRKGEVVTLVYARGPIEIVTLGRALVDAGRGEPVRAVNLASERPVRGIAVDRKLVRVGPVENLP